VSVAAVTHRCRVDNISATRRRCVGDGSRQRRVGDASASRRRRVDDASAIRLRRVGAQRVALVRWRGEEMLLKTSQAMGRVRQGVDDASASALDESL
jgi:hypothetical protein